MGRHSFTEADHLWTFERRAEMAETAEIAAEMDEIAEIAAIAASGARAAEPATTELPGGIRTACAQV